MKKFLLLILLTLPSYIYSQVLWYHKARIAGNPLTINNIDSIVKHANDSYVLGIEVDNDIPGRYESFLDPAKKLETIKKAAEKAHESDNYTFVYIAGLECITSNADKKEHTFFKNHPDWVQRDIKGRPAKFGANDAFWIDEGDEDVWISPYAKEWRKIYMERIKQIARTGIDGIYIDIPYWMTHFKEWENTWASFDDYTVAAFKEKTGLNANEDIKLGDFKDPGFIKWVKFRINTINDFLKEIDAAIKSVNPNCLTIAEIYPGIGEDAVKVGADVYSLYNIVDVIAHEYSEGKYYASEREPFNWYKYIFGMKAFRSFAGDKPTWMLSYSWNNDKEVKQRDAMKSLFASQIFNGVNTWDVKTYIMSSTNDLGTRKEVYKWIAENSDKLYYKHYPVDPVGIYFSPETRNLFADEYPESFFGTIFLLANSHIDYDIITPKTLSDFNHKAIILPDAKCLNNEEIETLNHLKNKGIKIIYIGETGKYDENRIIRKNPLYDDSSFSNNRILIIKADIGRDYYKILENNLNKYFYSDSQKENKIADYKDSLISEIINFIDLTPTIKIDAPVNILTTISKDKNGRTFIHLLNIDQLCEVCNKNISNNTIRVSFNKNLGKEVYFLPYIGNRQNLKLAGSNENFILKVPMFDRGAVLWIEE